MNIWDIYENYSHDGNQLSKQLCLYLAKKEMYFDDTYIYYLNKYYDTIFNKQLYFLSRQVLIDEFDCDTNKSIQRFYKKYIYPCLSLSCELISYKVSIPRSGNHPCYFSVSQDFYLIILSHVNTSKSLSLYRYFTRIVSVSDTLVKLCIQKDNFMKICIKKDNNIQLFEEYIKNKKDNKKIYTCCSIS